MCPVSSVWKPFGMLRKVEIQARVMEPTTDPLQFLYELEAFESRAKQAAFTMHTMCHLSFAPRTINPCTSIVRALYTLTALVSTLRGYLSPGPFSSRPDAAIAGAESIKFLSRRVGECEMIVQEIERASSKILDDGWLEMGKVYEGSLEFLPFDEDGSQAAHATIEACVEDILVTLTAARADVLSQGTHLTDDEGSELLYLSNALQHPQYATTSKPTPELELGTLTPGCPAVGMSVERLELQNPPGFRGRYGHPDLPPIEAKNGFIELGLKNPAATFAKSFEEAESDRFRLRSKGIYPDTSTSRNCLPSFSAPKSTQHHLLPGVMTDRRDSHLISVPLSPLIFPALKQPSKERGKGKQKSVTFATDSAAPAMGNNMSKEGTTPTLIQGKAKPGESEAHFEAYIIWPLSYEAVFSDGEVSISYHTESIPLSDADIEAHLRKLGDDHSIIEDICALPPTQVHLIRMRAKYRGGTIAYAQPCNKLDMQTTMGVFKASSVMFIIKTSRTLDIDKELSEYDIDGKFVRPVPPPPSPKLSPFGASPASPAAGFGSSAPTSATSTGFGSFNTKYTHTSAVGGFRTASTALSDFGVAEATSKPTSGFGSHAGSGVFGSEASFGFASAPTSTFGNCISFPAPSHSSFNITPAQPTTGLFAHKTPPPPCIDPYDPFKPSQSKLAQDYRERLERVGDPCTYIEFDNSHPPATISHYQSVTANFSLDISFEELRKMDLKAGRTGPVKHGFVYPWGRTKPQQAPTPATSSLPTIPPSGGLFVQGMMPNDGPGGFSVGVAQKSNAPGGLFGSNTHTSSNGIDAMHKSNGGLFGNLNEAAPQSGGLFGNFPQSAPQSRSLFGRPTFGPLPPSSTCGLFGSAPSPNAGSSSSGLFDTVGKSFGKSGQSAPASGSLFGTPPAVQTSAPASGGLFGSPANIHGQRPLSLFSDLFGDVNRGPTEHLQVATATSSASGPISQVGPQGFSSPSGTVPKRNNFGIPVSETVPVQASQGIFSNTSPDEGSDAGSIFGNANASSKPSASFPSPFGSGAPVFSTASGTKQDVSASFFPNKNVETNHVEASTKVSGDDKAKKDGKKNCREEEINGSGNKNIGDANQDDKSSGGGSAGGAGIQPESD